MIWPPYHRVDIDLLQSVEKSDKFLKLDSYHTRISYTPQFTFLESIKDAGNLSEFYKWVKGFNEEDIRNSIAVNENVRTCCNVFKLDEI